MAAKRKRIPRYSKVQINGHEYYKTDIEDADGKRVILYGKTRMISCKFSILSRILCSEIGFFNDSKTKKSVRKLYFCNA